MKKTPFAALFSFCVLVLFGQACTIPTSEQQDETETITQLPVDSLLQFAAVKMERVALSSASHNRFPRSFIDGKLKSSKPTGWTAGFFPGILWYMYQHTEKPLWKSQAHLWTQGLEGNKNLDWHTHDLGFMMYNSYGKGYELTQDTSYKAVLIQSADSLAQLYNLLVGTTESWPWRKNWSHPTIIDNMLNLELLLWGAKNGGDPQWKNMAISHADKTLANHIREDFTTYHVVDYDSASGAVRGRYTDQGASDNSTWSRGQAWGVYGFTMMFRETGEIRFLEAAQKLADVFLQNLPDDLVPYWDFSMTGKVGEPRDASAACIMASALVEIASFNETNDREKYADTALQMLYQLSEHYLIQKGENPFLIDHCTGSKPHNSEIDVPLVYADYYFIEALLRLKKNFPEKTR